MLFRSERVARICRTRTVPAVVEFRMDRVARRRVCARDLVQRSPVREVNPRNWPELEAVSFTPTNGERSRKGVRTRAHRDLGL